MSLDFAILLPLVVLAGGSCMFFVGGPYLVQRRIWPLLCLFVLLSAGICVAITARGFARRPDVLLSQPIMPDPDSAALAASAPSLLAGRFALTCEFLILASAMLMTMAALVREDGNRSSSRTFGLLLLSTAGVMLTAVANDLIIAAMALEVATLPALLMLWFGRRSTAADEAASKALFLHALSALLLLIGVALVYGLTSETNLTSVAQMLAESPVPSGSLEEVEHARNLLRGKAMLGNGAIVFLAAGLGLRLVAAPFHLGAVDVAAGAALWSSGWLAAAPRLAAFIALVRMLLEPLVNFEATGQVLLMVLAGLTMLIGGAAALTAGTIRRLFTGLLMSQGGFALVGLAVAFWDVANPQQGIDAGGGFPPGLSASLLFVATTLLSACGIVAVLVYLSSRRGEIEYVDELAGLVRAEPAAAVCLLLFTLSLTGVPPLAGFWARLFVLASCVSAYVDTTNALLSGFSYAFAVLALLGVCHLLCTAAICYRLAATMFITGQGARPRPAGGQPALAAGVIAAGILLATGLIPGPALGWFERIELINRAEFTREAGSADLPANRPPEARVLPER